MFRYLHGIGIHVAIYLPRERVTDSETISPRLTFLGT